MKLQTRAKWISYFGWLLAMSGVACVLLGLTNLQNLVIILAMGTIFIPFGLLILASGQILAGLAAIEKNTRPPDSAQGEATGANEAQPIDLKLASLLPPQPPEP